jgi:hypothetical protein
MVVSGCGRALRLRVGGGVCGCDLGLQLAFARRFCWGAKESDRNSSD